MTSLSTQYLPKQSLKLALKATALSLISAVILTGCASTEVAPIQADEKPTDVDEKGIWYQVDKHEKWLKTSGMIEDDPELNAYINDVVCDIAGDEYCKDMRVYIVKQPYFNASMEPNGMMQVWTGLLLRADSEAQMAFVLGHEFAHYKQRHSLTGYRNAKNTSLAATLAGLGLGLAGEGLAARVSQFAALAHLYGFSRDHEREADAVGFVALQDAGYNPHAGAQIWQKLKAEIEYSESRRKKRRFARSSLFNTHPITDERIKNLTQMADMSGRTGKDNAQALNKARAPFLNQWLEDDLVRRDYGESLFLINTLLEQRETPPQTAISADAMLELDSENQVGLLYYRRGEVYRLRREEGDNKRAIADFAKAASYSDTPAENWRQLADLRQKTGDNTGAAAAYTTYLSKNPNATDKLLIEKYITDLAG